MDYIYKHYLLINNLLMKTIEYTDLNFMDFCKKKNNIFVIWKKWTWIIYSDVLSI